MCVALALVLDLATDLARPATDLMSLDPAGACAKSFASPQRLVRCPWHAQRPWSLASAPATKLARLAQPSCKAHGAWDTGTYTHRSLCTAHAPAVPCVENPAPGVAGEVLALAGEALRTVELKEHAVPAGGGLEPLLAQLSHFSGNLDLTGLRRWVAVGGGLQRSLSGPGYRGLKATMGAIQQSIWASGARDVQPTNSSAPHEASRV